MPPESSNDVACAIRELAFAVRDHTSEQKMEFNWMVTHHKFATKQDIQELKDDLSMKISEVKTALQTASRQQKEALAEIGTQIADLNVKITELQNAATDPDVTDAEFNTLVADLQTDAQALANIVPGSPSPETPPTSEPGPSGPSGPTQVERRTS